MSDSLLMQIARDSIQEVLQTQNIINKAQLLQEHPLLRQKINTTISLTIDNEQRGSAKSKAVPKHSLLYEIIILSKRAAFEDSAFAPLGVLEYFHTDIEITLETPEGLITQKGPLHLQKS